MSANRVTQSIQDHSTNIMRKTPEIYGGMITFTDKDKTPFITAPLNKEANYKPLIGLIHLDYFKIDNAPTSTRIMLMNDILDDKYYEIEIAVSGTSTSWIRISDLTVKTTDPNGDNIVAPGIIVTYKKDIGQAWINEIAIIPNK